MMRVDLKPEPPVFEDRVRKKGLKYLAKVPNPTTQQWADHAYWTEVKFELYDAYCGICNFVCHWIPPDTGSITVEHYKPKAKYPADAYEWANYRLMCGTLNGWKSDYEDVLDPFGITNGMFVLDFPSLLVKPSKDINAGLQAQVKATIDRLKLNDEGTCIKARARYLKRYCLGEVDFPYLKSDAPFIAFELERQGLVTDIKTIMVYI
jgi:hypothetical protein